MKEDRSLAVGGTLPRRQLGRFLKEAREGSGLTLERAAGLMEWNKSTLSRLERGLTERVRVRDVLALCENYGLDDGQAAVAKGLAEQAPAESWWQNYRDLIPSWFSLYVGLEAGAEEMAVYQPLLIPGLLQTPDYARVIERRCFPDDTEEELERRVQVRTRRQHILTRTRRPAIASFLLHEAVLRTIVGNRRIMAAQLRHLTEIGSRPNVQLRILPFEAGVPLGTALPPFTIMDFGTDAQGRMIEPPVVYCENYTGRFYLEAQDDVLRFREAFATLFTAGPAPRPSHDLVREIAGSFARGR